jgi:hypothetical protein
MSVPGDLELEAEILRTKLTETEDKLKLTEAAVSKAVMETDLKIGVVMKRLLTANDVKADRAMRENILEQMNDLRRQVAGFFTSAGIKNAAHDYRGQIRDAH